MVSVLYSLSDFQDGRVIPSVLKQQIDAGGVTSTHVISVEIRSDGKIAINFPDEVFMVGLRKGTLDNIVGQHRANVDVYRKLRYEEIDAKTDVIISKGFVFAGVRLSLSSEAQSTLLAVDQMRNDPLMQFPLLFNAIDDSATVTIPDSNTAHLLVLTAIGTYRAALDSGSQLKTQVRSAATVEDILAVSDDRVVPA